MFSLNQPIGRVPFALGVGAANSLILFAILIVFAFMPSGTGHVAVLVLIAALMAWWFSLHARRFAGAGRSLVWPLVMVLVCYGTFAISYGIIAALWSVPEVQQEAFRTGGSDHTRHVETSAVVIGLGKWLAGVAGAAGALALTGVLALLMALVAMVSGVVSVIALVLPSRSNLPLLRTAPRWR